MRTQTKPRRPSALFELSRKLKAAQSARSGGAPDPDLIQLALAAGHHALDCSGPGWYPSTDLAAQPHAGQPILFELIGFRRIDIKINPVQLAQRAAELQNPAFADLTVVTYTVVRSLVRLVAGYYDSCPRDMWGHQRLIDAACWGAYQTTCPSHRERLLASSIASFFERSMVASSLTQFEGASFVSGLAMERSLNQHPPCFLWTLFKRSQETLFPAAWEVASTIHPGSPDPAADALLTDVLAILFRARLATVRGQLRLRGRIRRPTPWEWTEIVEDLAALLSPFLEEHANTEATLPNPFAPPPHSGQRAASGLHLMDPGDLLNPFLNPGHRALEGPVHLTGGGGMRAGTRQGPGLPCSFEALDAYYSQAQALELKDTTHDPNNQTPELIPVGYLDYSPANPRDLVSGDIDWFRTRHGPASPDNPSGLQFSRRTHPLEVPENGFEPAFRTIPNLLLVADSSGSMGFHPEAAGDARGRYDTVLRASWGLFRFLKEHRLEDRVWVNALNFSGSTRSSGWHRAAALDPVKRVLAAYQGGGTTLDQMALRKARETAPGRFVMVAITDGSLSNTAAALAELQSIHATGNALALLHVGIANAFTDGVSRLGGSVHILNHAQDLVGLCLDLAKAQYGTV